MGLTRTLPPSTQYVLGHQSTLGAAQLKHPVGERSPRGARRGALAAQLVLLSFIVTVTTAVTAAASVVRILRPQMGPDQPSGLADILIPALASVLPLILVGGLLGFLLALRVRNSVASIAAATARLGGGDVDAPIPQVAEIELAPLSEEVARVQSFIRTQAESQMQAATIEDVRERALLASLRDPVITTSVDGRVMGFNDAALSMFGKLQGHYDQTIQDLLPFVTLPAGGEQNRDQATGPQTSWQGRIVDVRGHPIELEVSWTPLAQGNLPATDVYVAHDVSRYAELSRLREQLIVDVAYELRVPLTTIENALQILSSETEELGPDDVAQLLRPACRSVARLRRLFDDLVLASRIQGGRLTLDAQPILVTMLVHDALAAADFSGTIVAPRVECHLPDAPVYARVDRYLTGQLLANLLVNARKRAGDDRPIHLTAEPVDGYVRFGIKDSGHGILPEHEALLLGRLDRARAAGEEPGMGLGLTIAKGIVEAHGGHIEVDRKQDGGTQIWLTLPTAPGA